jgi:hypothetical protein
MSAFTSQSARKHAQNVTRFLPARPHEALAHLSQIECTETRIKIANLIAQCWAWQDINAAWNAVALSPLSGTVKQHMFNELWG